MINIDMKKKRCDLGLCKLIKHACKLNCQTVLSVLESKRSADFSTYEHLVLIQLCG